MTGREVIEHWKQHLQDYPTCSHLMVQRPDLDALLREVERLETEASMYKRQCVADNKRWTTRLLQQIGYTNIWHGKFEVLRLENNKLRKKVQKSKKEES